MSIEGAYERLAPRSGGKLLKDESMARHTSYRIGGPAALFARCDSVSELARTLTVLDEEEVEWSVCGKGSNLLVADEGYAGAVVTLGDEFNRQDFGEPGQEPDGQDPLGAQEGAGVVVTAGAGTLLSRLVQRSYSAGLSGLEFAVGIPGTFGGALFMNAGTRDAWLSSVVGSVTTYNCAEGLVRRSAGDIAWRYRRGGFTGDEVIVEATLLLKRADNILMRAQMEASRKRRQRTQPLDKPSCGSVFRNPEGASVGNLIESCGLKGVSRGGAQVSEKHANFIVNNGDATARDVLELMHLVRDRVKEAHGIDLKPEVRFLGFAS